MRRVVVLPHPEGPSRLKNSPSAISRDRSSTAATSSNSLETRSRRTSISVTNQPPSPATCGQDVPTGRRRLSPAADGFEQPSKSKERATGYTPWLLRGVLAAHASGVLRNVSLRHIGLVAVRDQGRGRIAERRA